ncbi:alpha/beta hydrolase [Chloroflexota bacterium]
MSKKKGLWIVIGIIVAIIVLLVGVSAYMGHVFTTATPQPVESSPTEIGLSEDEFEEVEFTSDTDSITLRGWFLFADGSDDVIIMLHGNDYHRDDPTIGMLEIAGELVNNGYNVLTFDLRGHGESEVTKISRGYYEKRDLLGAIDYLKGRGFDDIGVLAYSMGAGITLITAAESDDIDAIVSDACFADFGEIVSSEMSRQYKIPSVFSTPMFFLIKVFYGVDITAISPIHHVADIAPTPILFIHGQEDETTPVAHADRLYEAAGQPKQLWKVPGAAHVRSYQTEPQEYITRITTFFDNVFK